MNDADLAFASIEEVARLFRKSKLSPVELTQLMLERVERLNPKLNAYITVPAEFALEQARQAERELLGPRGKRRDRGSLHGIPISLKDSIGTDTGGSIRIPAALCGVVGLKPTLGRVSVEGVIPLSPRLDCVGPLARTARDAAILLDAIFVRGKRERPLTSIQKTSMKSRKFRLGVPSEFFFDLISEDVRLLFDEAIRSLRGIGAATKEVSIPILKDTEDAGNQIALAEAAYYHQQSGWFPARAEEYGVDVRVRLQMGA